MKQLTVFDRLHREYDNWYDENTELYQIELKLVKSMIPAEGRGIEIGAGTGRFASQLGIATVIEPSKEMGKLAQERGLQVIQAYAEHLPIADNSYDFALMVTAICFIKDVRHALDEVRRILKNNGHLTVAFIDKKSPLGQLYQQKKNENEFYRDASFYSSEEVLDFLHIAGFQEEQTGQCLVLQNDHIDTNLITDSNGRGAFVAIKARNQK